MINDYLSHHTVKSTKVKKKYDFILIKLEKIMMVDTKLSAGPIDGQALTDLGTVYNIPIVSLPAGSLEHGTYQIAIVHATTKNAQGSVATTLRLDGFRVC